MLFLDSFDIKVNRERVFERIQCKKNTEGYDRYVREYEEILDKTLAHIKPKAVLCIDTIPKEFYQSVSHEQKGIYVLFTLGNLLEKYVESFFDEDNYVQGLLADAIADDYLFQMDESLQVEVKKMCDEYYIHTVKRLEAPEGISIDIQKSAFERCRGKELLNLRLNESFMFDPIKTLCIIYEIEAGEGDFVLEHSCVRCEKLKCDSRVFKPVLITVQNKEKKNSYEYIGGESLLSFLRKHDLIGAADCGGLGLCGKCKIQLLYGKMEITKADREIFSKRELEEGFRLACKAYPTEDITIEANKSKEEMQILTLKNTKKEDQNSQIAEIVESEFGEYGVAIDIGTTTIAMVLVSINDNKIIKQHAGINHQKTFGADVISRIEASNNGKNFELQQIIKRDLWEGILKVTDDFEYKVNQIVISGNTTMIHLLMNYDCKELGIAPYHSSHLDKIETNIIELFGERIDASIFIMPGISAFIGGDIVSGLFGLDVFKEQKNTLLIDLGTNGELVIGSREELICASTAIGPAFEGGKIYAGVPSVSGAICRVQRKGTNSLSVQTIFDKKPIGICGSGVIDVIALLLDEKIIDETGLLKEEYFETGFPIYQDEIRITQKDIREVQLAKAAVAAGIETLLKEYGEQPIAKVYLAGGFGDGIDIENAKKIGLLPKQLEIELVGNTSIFGGVKLLQISKERQLEEIKQLEKMIKKARMINLSENVFFQEKYIENMYY